MSRRRKTNFSQSAILNNYSYIFYLDQLTDLAVSMFEYKGLPDTIDERYLEMGLYEQGRMIFFEDDVLGYLALRMTTQGRLNVYRNPIRRRAYADNGYNQVLDEDNSVIIYNNYLRKNTLYAMQYYALRLWDLDNTIAVNARAQKTPVLLQAPEQQRLTVLNLYKEFDGNSPVIHGDDNLDLNSLKVLRTDAPYVADKIYMLKTQIWNEALTCLGISNTNIQKKERLLSDEIAQNQGSTVARRFSRLTMRRKACDEINRMFGLNIECNVREDFQQIATAVISGTESQNTGDTGVKDE